MITLRKAAERGHANHGWLDSHHSFSFADYYDPAFMGVGNLRVINEDRIAPGTGFGTHGRRGMEIIWCVLEGGLAHRDALGTGSVIRAGDVQRMSAGSGVSHSEFNASPTDPVHFLQIWLLPTQRDIPPSYEQKSFSEAEKRGRLRVVASPDGRDGSVTIHSDALLYAGVFEAGESTKLALAAGRHAWVQVAHGQLRINGENLASGDGAALSDVAELHLEGVDHAEALVFDLA